MNRHHALIHAHEAHKDQVDKCGLPYIFHPLAVGHAVAHLGEDFEVVAYLHDVLEDTDHELPRAGDDVRKYLTHRQAEALDAVTRQPDCTYAAYVHLCRENFIARVVKLADIDHNLSPERHGCLMRRSPREATSLEDRYKAARAVLME